ncbi:alanine racemase [Streptococcus chenjunshii]|uniref:Alanine racemase n=1 Tax=Streptococcus chenjunshii TaxID=2173853 RepID=A0A372KM17_9STRE|nr:alanine racemase [Streptococcus chenjunshii]AXQ78052.1 alanine racemase [Streptococcus chenjunshii]RFU51147.1 alanine racemase [Streptococcus chenjunshii]RFU53313.1 alanine racemase [Streptococcus chenjunshii]
MIPSVHRPTRAIINLQAIADNVRTIQQHIPRDTKTYAVVKADAYGHGAVKTAHFISRSVDAFAVSNLDEALELRQSGISNDILILGPIAPEDVDLAKESALTVTVSSQNWLELARSQGVDMQGLTVHVKVDSGMGRIGVRSAEEANTLLAELQKSGSRVEGIFTHFATADEADDSKLQQQLAFFKNLLERLDNRPNLIHASNSAASLWHGETIFNAVRLGIAIYGLNPSGTALPLPYPLKPALSLESALIQVKKVEKGADIGYGASYTASAEQYIGTVPIGYADGWTRDLQGFSLLVDGLECEIVGRISMDQLTIRLSEPYPLGTKVTLIGSDGDKEISATDVAHKRDTISYEILCLLSSRIPRLYLGL